MDELEPDGDPEISFDVAMDASRTAVVTIRGELDISSIDALAAEVAPVLERDPARLVVDVGAVRFADSSAIALWVRWAGIVDQFELRHPTPLLRRVIAGMGLAQKLAVTP